MDVIITSSYDELCAECVRLFSGTLRAKPGLVVALPTGRTPLGVYELLVRECKAGRLDLSRARAFGLDEFVGLAPDDERSFHFFLWKRFFGQVNIRPANARTLNRRGTDLRKICDGYENEISRAGGLDLAMLGIGGNGHIGFNEPGSSLGSRTRVKTLVKSPGKGMPRLVLTMGIGTIMEARQVVILASGAGKARIVKKMIEGPVTAELPASVLQMHPRCACILDSGSARLLKRRKYWEDVRRLNEELESCR
jgi:glucosamine-6-phosphate deaminase